MAMELTKFITVALLLLVAALDPAASSCRQGSEWIEYNGHCYHWTRQRGTNWFRAELNCKSFGGHLTSIPSLADNNFLHRLTQCSDAFWIGMVNTNPSMRTTAKGFEWWDGTAHNYTNLNTNNKDYLDCVYFSLNGKWYTDYCQHQWGYVCKAPATASESLEVYETETASHEERGPGVAWVTPTTATSLAWPTPTAAPFRCPAGWQLMDRSCYFVSDNRTNYFNAQMSCQAMGASVTSILTPREHTLLTVVLGCHSPVWIGLEKARPCFKQPSKDHCWVWMDRNPVNYVEWSSGQTLDRRDAECVILDGQWKVINCYNEYRYICKRAAFSSSSTK